MKKLGLIGYPLGHSFSKKYYMDKMEKENIVGIDYDLYPIPSIIEFPSLFTDGNTTFVGCNVTIPYKQAVMPYLQELSDEAREIGAVNCITIQHLPAGATKLVGYNTDAYGFEKSLRRYWNPEKHNKALVLGNGGAAKAVLYVLKKLGVSVQLVSRSKSETAISYEELSTEAIAATHLIINCTPLGTFPDVDVCPPIPYDGIGQDHYLYDLIYNPEETLFLKQGRLKGAVTKNGFEMLVLQADKNWEIWQQAK
ncbi:shikimate dehydrogenase [Sphingobacterium sp. lm-10]|uniref:shikimate dehydrogenase family protein n=1 Tax=Sphingobacterium sp. lm-10 TaxID=2944904 RepID=UPI00201FCE10|nr:shikimate dehydrogenase [Sphingobacterium sp. lm-10]MCL7988375.1 shikimate dehydrogenase [Sphingobacterium sp. lm-10]